jgi:Skp family chaperone for outer membrane proteins
MKHGGTIFVLASAAVAAAAVSLRGGAPPQHPGSVMVATTDLERVFNGIDRLKKAEAQLEQKLKPFRDQADALKLEAEKLRMDVDSLAPGTKMHEEAQKKLSRKAWEFRAQVDFINARLDAARGEARSGLFQDIQAAAGDFCREQGIDLLVADDSGLPVQPGNDIQVVQQLALRRVVYSNPAMDVTDALIKWINEHP